MTTIANKNLIFIRKLIMIFSIVPLLYSPAMSGENHVNRIQRVQKKSTVHRGIIISKFKSGNYLYVEFKDGDKSKWAAAYAVVAAKGDTIELRNPMEMRDFYSKSLKKTFKTIYFTGVIKAVSTDSGKTESKKMPGMMHAMKKKSGLKTVITPGSVKKAAGGYSVSECFQLSSKLKGKVAIIRGIAVKVSSKILGKNWVHIQDGTGKPGENDITVTTKSNIKKGDIVLVKGKIEFKKSIGGGYIFPALIEDAEITIQKGESGHKKK
ncbi:MAG: hypothetical protein ABFR75_02580 [Acidobacteriota bacterium]